MVYELHMVRIFSVDCLEADVFDVFKHVHIFKITRGVRKADQFSPYFLLRMSEQRIT